MKGRAPVCFVVEASSLLCYLVITDERCWLRLCAFICSVAVCVFLPSGCGAWSGVAPGPHLSVAVGHSHGDGL